MTYSNCCRGAHAHAVTRNLKSLSFGDEAQREEAEDEEKSRDMKDVATRPIQSSHDLLKNDARLATGSNADIMKLQGPSLSSTGVGAVQGTALASITGKKEAEMQVRVMVS